MRWDEDGPARDPLDVAAEHAAGRLYLGEPMTATDWDALKQKATSELNEYDGNFSF